MCEMDETMTKTMKHREACKKYYESHKEKILNQRRIYRHKNRIAFNLWYREYYAKNRERIIQQRKKKLSKIS